MMRRCLLLRYAPFSGMSGRPFPPSELKSRILAEAATIRGYTSPYWLTSDEITIFIPRIAVKPDAGDGVTTRCMAVDRQTGFLERCDTLHFNAEQTTDPTAIASFVATLPAGDFTSAPRSALNGKQFPPGPASILTEVAENCGYTSPYWLTDDQIRKVIPAVNLRPDAGEGVPLNWTSSKGHFVFRTMYNADQTMDPEAVNKLAATSSFTMPPEIPGSIHESPDCPRSGVTGELFPLFQANVLADHAKTRGFKSHYWLTIQQIMTFTPRIGLKPDAGKCAIVTFYMDARGPRTHHFYNADQTTNPEAVAVAATLKCPVRPTENDEVLQTRRYGAPPTVVAGVSPSSGLTGLHFPPSTASLLTAAATARGFTSPYWLSLQQIKTFVPPITLKPDAGDGVTMQGTLHVYVYYNADQTTDPEAVTVIAMKTYLDILLLPRSGVTGKVLGSFSDTKWNTKVLAEAAKARGFTSPYWLTSRQLEFSVPQIVLRPDAGKGVLMQRAVDDATQPSGLRSYHAMYYNADQTMYPEAVAATATNPLLASPFAVSQPPQRTAGVTPAALETTPPGGSEGGYGW